MIPHHRIRSIAMSSRMREGNKKTEDSLQFSQTVSLVIPAVSKIDEKVFRLHGALLGMACIGGALFEEKHTLG